MRAEQPHIMAGGEKPFDLFRGTIRCLFASNYCCGIIYECQAGKRALLLRLNAPELEAKIHVIPSGVPIRNFIKTYDNKNQVKLLFVNSANINVAWNFSLKGGQILLEVFRILKLEYENLELLIRSGIPEKVKKSYQGIPGLRIKDRPMPWSALEKEFKAADIFVMPSYVTPSMVFFDAMSYELPIVTTDVWANSEYIRDRENGLLVHNPLASSYTEGDIVHFDSPAFQKALQTVDRDMVDKLVAAIKLLIENVELRRKMGVTGREWVEKEHSMEVWRTGLKKVLDKVLSNQNDSL
jgi:glycosyltransferase involved in cell wall biosynthesis